MTQRSVSTTFLRKKIVRPLPIRRPAQARHSTGTRVLTSTGADFSGLVDGAGGGISSACLGEELDTKVLDSIECRQCGHSVRPHVESPFACRGSR